LKRSRAGKEVTHVNEEWEKLKEIIVETMEHTLGYQPKPHNRGWFD
jgi:hypothetical protein